MNGSSGGNGIHSPTAAGETKSVTSIKSGKSRNSAVMQKARAYNRIIEHKQQMANGGGGGGGAMRSSPTTTASATAVNTSLNSSGASMKSSSSPTQMQQHSQQHQQQQQQQHARYNPRSSPRGTGTPTNGATSSPDLAPSTPQQPQQQQQQQPHNAPGAVTPELLVDALSGHEDGLLAIAERLMEHYDGGYDVMGEAIIDAFADVQKLFQHVVEAAHMEGAAYEAGRRDEELEQLRNQVRMGVGGGGEGGVASGGDARGGDNGAAANKKEPGSPVRHEEFIDQDVRDILTTAIRNTFPFQESQHAEAYSVLEQACQSASALLPVDSDHRGRLQLSLARAESMPPGRACAILKYVMDDVLRSGLTVHSKVILPDPSERGDCVLSPKGGTRRGGGAQNAEEGDGEEENLTRQSPEEALASMVEEMKDILGAPMYDHSPLQSVSDRFWKALAETQRDQNRKEERLEQKLAMLKGDFLLAREEWEDKYNQLSRESDHQTRTISKLQQQVYMEAAKQGVAAIGEDYPLETPHPIGTLSSSLSNHESQHGSPRSGRPASSVGSFASLSQHAKSFVGSFACGAGSAGRFDDIEEEGETVNRRGRIDGSPPSVVSSSISQGMTSGGAASRKGMSSSFRSHSRRSKNEI